MRARDAAGLAAAGAGDRTSYAYTWVPDGRADAAAYVEAALQQQRTGRVAPFTVFRAADHVVLGSTRFLDLETFASPDTTSARRSSGPVAPAPPSVAEIGGTWYAAAAQRTGVNAETKLLMLTHAFEVWRVVRVTFKTDARNAASRAALERLGAHFEGVRRAHVLAHDGTVRDSAYYSITAPEWLSVRDDLRRRLSRSVAAP